jgi:molecular chaperone GrpE (heat shock protein)
MAVHAGVVNDIVADTNTRVRALISDNNLESAMGTTKLNRIQGMLNEFVNMANDTFTLPDTTEGMLRAEADDVVNSIAQELRRLSGEQQTQLSGLMGAHLSTTPADSPIWNEVVSSAGAEIDRIARVYSDQVANMPKAMRSKLDTDLARVLDTIREAYMHDPSPGNAENMRKQVMNALAKIDKDLESASKATLAASIQSIAAMKATKLQELEVALVSAERGMEKAQRGMWRSIAAETKALIMDLTKSNYLVYDKVVRKQKISVIDGKLALLDNIRVNATTKMQTLQGYFGNTGVRASRKQYMSGSSLGGFSQPMRATPKSAFKTKPPGFSGYSGGGGYPLED